MDKRYKITTTTVKFKYKYLENISSIMDFIFKQFCDILMKLIYSWSYAVK